MLTSHLILSDLFSYFSINTYLVANANSLDLVC